MKFRSYKQINGIVEVEAELHTSDMMLTIPEIIQEVKKNTPMKRVPMEDLDVSYFGVDNVVFVTLKPRARIFEPPA
jgi:hypothetical protein